MSKIIKITIVVSLLGVWIYFFFNQNNSESPYLTEIIQKNDLIQTVNETGTVKAKNEVILSFLNSGQIQESKIQVGDQVEKGDKLASLDYSDLLIKKTEAETQLEIAKTQLKKLLEGATSAEIAVTNANVNQTKTAYQKSKIELETTKKAVTEQITQSQKRFDDLTQQWNWNLTPEEQAVTIAETSLQNTQTLYQQSIEDNLENASKKIDSSLAIARFALDTINNIIDGDEDKKYLSVKNIDYLSQTKLEYLNSLDALESTQITYDNLDTTASSEVKTAIQTTELLLNNVSQNLNTTFHVLENSVTTSEYLQSNLDSDKTTINTQITTVSNALISIQTAKQNLNTALLNYTTNTETADKNLQQAKVNLENARTIALNNLNTAKVNANQQISAIETRVANTKSAWEVAQKQLIQIQTPARQADISLQKAQIKQAETAIETISNQIKKSIITAPMDGTITQILYDLGENMTASKPAIYLLQKQDLEIKVDISESDINKIKLNDKAEITLDAFPEHTKFFGRVSQIDPAETTIQDVIYYQITLILNTKSTLERGIKPWMTANVTITTAEKKNVLTIPSRAIIDRNGDWKFTRILENGEMVEKKIEIGLRGDNGMTELVSGIKEGDEVVTYIKK